jgi:hypothetical protein
MFAVGDRVDRIEQREVTGATVIGVSSSGNEHTNEQILELEYDEGGTGFWPSTAVVLIEPAVVGDS